MILFIANKKSVLIYIYIYINYISSSIFKVCQTYYLYNFNRNNFLMKRSTFSNDIEHKVEILICSYFNYMIKFRLFAQISIICSIKF